VQNIKSRMELEIEPGPEGLGSLGAQSFFVF
jgi:hypothetical protein